MKVDLVAYLRRNLKPDTECDLTDSVLEYVAKIESQNLQAKVEKLEALLTDIDNAVYEAGTQEESFNRITQALDRFKDLTTLKLEKGDN